MSLELKQNIQYSIDKHLESIERNQDNPAYVKWLQGASAGLNLAKIYVEFEDEQDERLRNFFQPHSRV